MLFSALRSAAFLIFCCAPLCAGQINFVYPPQGTALPSVLKTFVFGNISPAASTFTINGEKISVNANGGFIAYLPVSEGDFAFKGQLSDGTTAQLPVKVRVSQEAKVPAGALRLEISGYDRDSEFSEGDYIRVAAAGTPGKQAVFSLGALDSDEPMTESPAGSGHYYGSYKVKAVDGGKEVFAAARFKAGLFARGASARAKGRIKILKHPVLLETSTDTVVLRNAPDGGYMLFLQKGVKLISDGRLNGMHRVVLSGEDTGWVEDPKVQAPAGAPFPSQPITETGSIKLKKTDFGVSAVINIYDKVPYAAEELQNGLRVTFYYTSNHTNWVVYDSSDTLVKNVAFRQKSLDTVEVDFETEPGALWGYNVAYSTSSKAMQVDLRSRPEPSLAWPRPLSGLRVVLDPGHSPYLKCANSRPPLQEAHYSALPASANCSLDGAVGPMETFEVNVNLAIARRLKDRLLALGASVGMTRNGDENVDLTDRPRIAKDLGGDLFISVHNNAIGDGEDPFAQPRGFQVYYYQRHSRELADALHKAYVKNIPLPDEGLRYGDYYVVRQTWMPAVLTESAYMIFPGQEELLNSSAFQEKLAAAMAEGVLNFFRVPAQPKKGKK